MQRLSILLPCPVCCFPAAWALFVHETHDEVGFCLFRLWPSCIFSWTASSSINGLLLDLLVWASSALCADRWAKYY
ncbi:hypothetical protein F5883DRAFT_583985 [Diaporthe sp. PMI_573]|nr:hypothetical protein F5883DRAFT_583985 [Diaporthaceae sp. PMI_573]